jgi:hypothetical protein
MEAVRIYQGSEEALRSGQGRLANAYRTYCERGSSDGQQLNVSVNAGVPITAGERRDRPDAPAEVARRQLRNDYVTDPSMDRAHSVLESDASGVRNDGLANAPGQTPASFQAAPDLMTTRQEQNMQTPLPSWTMSHATAAQYVPPSNNGSTLFSETLHPERYTDNPGAPSMSSRDQIERATSGIADRQICILPPLQEITGQSAAMGRRGEDVHNLHLQWQPDAELGRRQETAAEAACFRPSPNANNPTLTENVMDASLSSRSYAGSTGMDALAAAAWHHDRLQDGLDPRVTGLGTDPTTDIEEAQNGGPQDPAVRTSATQETNMMNHQTHEAEPNAIASNRNTKFGQTSQRSWQPFDPSWSQEPIASETTYNGAMNPFLNGYGAIDDWDTMVEDLYAVWR